MNSSLKTLSKGKAGCVATLSGGLDSSVALAMARLLCPVVETVTFDYGQRAAANEIRAARRISQLFEIPHRVIALPWLSSEKCSLLNRNTPLPQLQMEDLHDKNLTQASAESVWVP